MNKRDTLIQEVQTLLNSIQGIRPYFIDSEDRGGSYAWQKKSQEKLSIVFKRLDDIFKFVSESELERLKRQLQDLEDKITKPSNHEITLDECCEFIESIGENIKLSFPHDPIGHHEFDSLLNKISKFNISFPTEIRSSNYFESLSDEDLEFLLKSFINLYNSDFIEDQIVKNNLVDQIKASIKHFFSSQDKDAELINKMQKNIDENKELKLAVSTYISEREEKDNEIKNRTDELNKKLSNFTNNKITQTFDSEANKIDGLILKYSRTIISLFLVIVLLIAAKVFFYFCPNFSLYKQINDPYFIFCFFSLIVSISALLTYLIRERKRLTTLHDHYKRTHLELEALPDYMFELSEKQRQELVIDLAKNYFSGLSNDNKSNQSPESDNASEAVTYLKILSDNIKSLNDKLTK